jgi:alpha-L-fucosidase
MKSVGRGANLLLNVPPDRRGLINEHDSVALIGFKRLRNECFSKNLAYAAVVNYFSGENNRRRALYLKDGGAYEAIKNTGSEGLEWTFPGPRMINCLMLSEKLNDGQHCIQFRLELKNEKGESIRSIDGNTIGRKRIITFPSTRASRITLVIKAQKSPTSMAAIEAYQIPESLLERSSR